MAIYTSSRSSLDSNFTKGVGFGLAYGFFLAVASLAVHVGSGVDSTELTFYRGAAGLVFFSGIAVQSRALVLKGPALPLWLRAIASSTSILCYYWTLQASNITIASSLLNLAPVFVIFLAALFLKERISRAEIAAVVIAVVSVTGLGAGIASMVWIVGLAGSVTGAMSFTALRASAQRFQAGLVVWMLSLFLVLSALLVKQGHIEIPTAGQLPVVASVCVFGVLSQFLQTKSYSYLPAAVAASLGLSSVLWSFVFDVALFGRTFGPLQIASYALFIGATSVLVYQRNSPAN